MDTKFQTFMKWTCFCIAALVLISTAQAQQSSITYLRADPQVVQSRLSPVPATQHERVQKLRQQFRAAKVYGPIEVTEYHFSEQPEPNLICKLPGSREPVILVAADTAYKSTGDEAQLNWATLEMMPLLVESLAASPSHHTLQFIAFNGSKGRRSGVASYLARMSKADRKNIAAVIELDHLGRMPASYAPLSGGDALGKRLRTVAWTMKYQVPGFYVDEHTGETVGTGPIARSFEHARVPAITIYSRDHSDLLQLAPNGMPTYVEKLNLDSNAYYETYLLLCAYLREIDRDLSD